MFTGLVEEVGVIEEADDHRLLISANEVMQDLATGHSIAVSGACLTVIEATATAFAVELSEETRGRTNLGSLVSGDLVNLERALMPTTRLGGHIVQGHVDGIGKVLELKGVSGSSDLKVGIPLSLRRYVVEKGFIAVEGISLTVVGLDKTGFNVAVIPYTLDHTNLRSCKAGDPVNLEVDILAKYVERLFAKEGIQDNG